MAARQNLGSVLVVGDCGFLGHRIVAQLIDSDATTKISVLALKIDRNRNPNVSYHAGDISSKSNVQSIFNRIRPQIVIHTASPPPFAHNMDFLMRVNVEGTRNLLVSAQEVGSVVAFVYTSSASIIHDSVNDLVDADESFLVLYMPVQRVPHSHTKALAEDLVLSANRKNGDMLTVSLRPSGLFGEGDPTTVRPMVDSAASGKYKYQVGDGSNLFDWTYVENAAHAHILAACALLKAHRSSSPTSAGERVDGEAFFITNDEATPFWDFARSLGAAAGYPTKLEDIRAVPRIVGLMIAMIAEWMVWLTSLGRKQSSMTRMGIKYSTMTRTYPIDKAKKRLQYKSLVGMEEATRKSGESFVSDSKKTE